MLPVHSSNVSANSMQANGAHFLMPSFIVKFFYLYVYLLTAVAHANGSVQSSIFYEFNNGWNCPLLTNVPQNLGATLGLVVFCLNVESCFYHISMYHVTS